MTWANAPSTITLNRSTLPPPETTDPLQQELIRAVVTHETGHALGLGRAHARRQHSRMREHAHEAECRQGRGTLHRAATGRCRPLLHAVGWNHLRQSSDADHHARRAPRAGLRAARHGAASPARRGPAHDRVSLSGRTCERIPQEVITPEQVESDSLPTDPGSFCVRAPAGVLFHVHLGDGVTELALTDGHGEFAFRKPDSVGVEVDMPEGVNGRFPSLLGYQPVDVFDRIPAMIPIVNVGHRRSAHGIRPGAIASRSLDGRPQGIQQRANVPGYRINPSEIAR